MFKILNKKKNQESKLYNKILLLSRNKFFYTKLGLDDSFNNRIYLIFLHTSFLFIKIKQEDKNLKYKELCQKTFDVIFNKIELNMREMVYGDVTVNKNMKLLVKIFYNILLESEVYTKKNLLKRKQFLLKYLTSIKLKNNIDNIGLVDYFDKYQAFCFALRQDSVLNDELKFNYN